MFRDLSNLRPRTLARTNEAIEQLKSDSRELRRLAKLLEEQQRKFETTAAQSAQEIRELKEHVARLSARESQLRSILEADVSREHDYEQLNEVLHERRIAKSAKAALEQAELHWEPFPHVIVQDLFPVSFYKTLVSALPPVELFEGPVNHQQLRTPFALAPAFSRRVWKFMVGVGDSVLLPMIVDKFRPALEPWITENWPSLAGSPLASPMDLHSTGGRILLRRRGYNIPPHRDPKWGFITCLIYLVRPGDPETWGTSLYSVDEDKEARGALPHWINASTCRLAREVPFRRNTALLFLNSVGAHGASIPEDAQPADLERYAYQFRIGPTRDSIKALMELLPDDRRPVWAGKLEE